MIRIDPADLIIRLFSPSRILYYDLMKHIVATLLALGSAVLLTEAAPRTKTLELQEVLRVASTIDQLLEKDLKAAP